MPKWTEEQLDAIKKDGTNIIVSAGAGSGKTAVLTERVIEKLRNGIHINELLILTFTRAAAAEMKDRIRKKIKSSDDLQEELKVIDSAYITTFDSYALSILKKYHYLLNIPQNINICDESILEIKSKELFDEVFNGLYKSQDELFFKLINKFCLKNDDLLRKTLFEISKKINNNINRDFYLKELKESYYCEETFEKLYRELTKIIDDSKKLIRACYDNVCNYFDDRYIEKVNEIIESILNINSFNDIANISSLTLPRVPTGSLEEGKAAKEQLKDAIDNLKDLRKYANIDYLKESFYENKKFAIAIIDILQNYYLRLDEYKDSNYMYSFIDIAKKSINILKSNPLIAGEIRDSLKEIMIDEYQDTNDVQEEFISLISNNNVYMVGDVKQSIYRFRGANPSIFRNKYNDYSDSSKGIRIDLNKNFRSRLEVINGINDFFNLLMNEEVGGANYIEEHQMIFGNTNYSEKNDNSLNYNFEVLEYNLEKDSIYTSEEVEIFAVAKDIKEKVNKALVFDKETGELRKSNYSDFVIILDRSKHFELYKKIFEYLDIPLEILKDGELNSSIDLKIIKNLVELIILIHDEKYDIDFKYNFMSVGRSFLYEYTDEYLFDVITNNKWEETTLYNDLKQIKNYNSKTAFELFNELLDVTDLYNKIYKIGDYESIDVRLEKISNITRDLNELNLSFEELNDYLIKTIEMDIKINYTAASSSSDSVKILTIHKSKGLEYPFCYYSDLCHKFNTQDIKSNFIATDQYGLITPLIDLDDETNFIKELYVRNYKKEEISEKIRLFYVALTRAREKAIIVLPYSEECKCQRDIFGSIVNLYKTRVNSLSELLTIAKHYLSNYYKSIEINDLQMTKDYLLNKKINNLDIDSNLSINEVKNVNIIYNEVDSQHFSKTLSKLISKKDYDNMKFGTYIHEALEFVDLKNKDLSFISDENTKRIVSNFLELKELNDISNANIYHEYEFMYSENDIKYHGIIDLMIEYDNEIKIIDFKTKNINDDNYEKQLKGYADYIKKKSNKQIRMYLYSILDNKLMEITCN